MNLPYPAALLLSLLLTGCSGDSAPPAQPAPAPQAAPVEPAPAPAAPPAPDLWSDDCKTWAGFEVPIQDNEGMASAKLAKDQLAEGPCKPGEAPKGADSLIVVIEHAKVEDSSPLNRAYEQRAEAAGWKRTSPPDHLPRFEHADHPGWVLTMDGHLDEEGGGFLELHFIVKPKG
ncbi:MAG: hypothetical protein H6739_20880 [Alphaproteobacteria bacterium]|nr:hypothetical protein [Alphaproteobacteria bacterium]